jgi:aspartyl/asparaginyl beta-hydroxylase (cupin superfamily)
MKFRDWNLAMYNRLMSNSPYLNMDTYFKDHSILEDNWKVIKEEIESIISKADTLPKFHEVDKGQEFISDNDGIAWSMFNVKTYGFWHSTNVKQCPKTVEIIKSLKNVSGVYFSILDAGKHIPAHNGPYKGILRYQLALSVQSLEYVKYLLITSLIVGQRAKEFYSMILIFMKLKMKLQKKELRFYLMLEELIFHFF